MSWDKFVDTTNKQLDYQAKAIEDYCRKTHEASLKLKKELEDMSVFANALASMTPEEASKKSEIFLARLKQVSL